MSAYPVMRLAALEYNVSTMCKSLPAMILGDWFCMSRKGRTGGGGLVHPKGVNSMAVSVFGCKILQ